MRSLRTATNPSNNYLHEENMLRFVCRTALMTITAAFISNGAFPQQAPPAQEKSKSAKAVRIEPASSTEIAIPDIPYTKFVLKNGLTLLVHEDHKLPVVAVNTW